MRMEVSVCVCVCVRERAKRSVCRAPDRTVFINRMIVSDVPICVLGPRKQSLQVVFLNL